MPIKYNAPVVLTFSLMCTAVYVLNISTAGAFMPLFVRAGTFNPGNLLDYITMFSYIIGHDYSSIDHLLGNLTFLLLLGPILEEKYGSANLLWMILFTALVTAILNILLFSTGIVGASGIVFMFIILASFANARQGSGIPLTFILVVILFIGKEVIMIFNEDNISQFGHIMGGIAGSMFGFGMGVRGSKV